MASDGNGVELSCIMCNYTTHDMDYNIAHFMFVHYYHLHTLGPIERVRGWWKATKQHTHLRHIKFECLMTDMQLHTSLRVLTDQTDDSDDEDATPN